VFVDVLRMEDKPDGKGSEEKGKKALLLMNEFFLRILVTRAMRRLRAISCGFLSFFFFFCLGSKCQHDFVIVVTSSC
jgi:hypothetical protein